MEVGILWVSNVAINALTNDPLTGVKNLDNPIFSSDKS